MRFFENDFSKIAASVALDVNKCCILDKNSIVKDLSIFWFSLQTTNKLLFTERRY